MNNCKNCDRDNSIVPLNRVQLTAVDGGIVELLIFTCTECRTIKMEHPKVYLSSILLNEGQD